MTQTFEGKSCRIHYNSDLSGEIEVQTERAEDRVKTFYAVSPGTDICTTRIDGSDLLFFFRHLQEPGGALAPGTAANPASPEASPPAQTPAQIIRGQIEKLQRIQEYGFVNNDEGRVPVALAIGTLAEKLHTVERGVKNDASKPD